MGSRFCHGAVDVVVGRDDPFSDYSLIHADDVPAAEQPFHDLLKAPAADQTAFLRTINAAYNLALVVESLHQLWAARHIEVCPIARAPCQCVVSKQAKPGLWKSVTLATDLTHPFLFVCICRPCFAIARRIGWIF